MPAQVIEAPSQCPECGARVCATGLSARSVTLHCGAEHDEGNSECEWSEVVPVDEDADGITIVSREAS